MNTVNPLALLDALLGDYASPKVRRAIHSLILFAGLVITVYLAAGRNWEQAIITLALSLYAEANKANTPAHDLDPAGADSVPDDGESYEEAGGMPMPEIDAAPVKPNDVDIPLKRDNPPLVSGEPVTPTQDTPRDAGL